MKAIILSLLFILTSCSSVMAMDRKVQVVVANLKFKKLEKVEDLRGVHDIYKKALPYLGSNGVKEVNVETIKLYSRTLKFHDNVEHIETIWPAIEKEKPFFEELIKKTIEDKKDQKKILEHIKEYGAFIKRGNG